MSETPEGEALAQALEAAGALGLKVIVMGHKWLLHPPTHDPEELAAIRAVAEAMKAYKTAAGPELTRMSSPKDAEQ